MALPSVVEQSTSKVLSVISTKLDDKASRADTIARIEIAVRRLHFVIEKTGKKQITYVSLLQSWNVLKLKYMEGMDLLNKYKPRQELDGQVVVRSSSYFHRFAKRAANLSISSLVGLVNEQLTPSAAQTFERYVDWAEKSFVADVESSCPLRHDTFRYPFLWHLFRGKTLFYKRMKGKQQFAFLIEPVILEGRGVEAILGCRYLDPDRLDKSFFLVLMLRISESTDIVGTAINCLRSSTSLLNPVAQDAARELTLLHNSHDISYSFDSRLVSFQELYVGCTKSCRSDPLCCQAANGHEPSVNNIISSELSQMFSEETIMFCFECYVPMPKCRMASVSDQAHSNAVVHRRGRPQPLVVRYFFLPHFMSPCMLEANWTVLIMLSNKEERGYDSIFGNSNNIPEDFDMARLGMIHVLTVDEPDATDCVVMWTSKHGSVCLQVEKPGEGIVTAPKASGRYKTRSAKKRKM